MDRKLLLGAVAVVGLALSGCVTTMADPRKHSFKPVELGSFAGVPDAMGKLVVLEGKAFNTRAGPVVVGNGLSVYCRGMNAWPESMIGRQVTVSGLLDHARTDEVQAAGRAVGGSGSDLTDYDYVLKHPKLEQGG